MKERVISGVLILVILLPFIYVGNILYIIGVAVLSVLAYKELCSLPSFDDVPLALKIYGTIFYLLLVVNNQITKTNTSVEYLYLIVLFLYMLVPSLIYGSEKYKIKDGMYMLAMMVLLGLSFSSLIYMRNDLSVLIYLVSITVLSDTFAYFTGLLIGKHKLCPTISPKKTVEGSIGGFIVGVSIPLIIYYNLIGDVSGSVVFMSVVLAVVSQVGDLIFSKIKRDEKIKDFSNLIPGHGGVLDRLDSLLFVSIIYLVFSSII